MENWISVDDKLPQIDQRCLCVQVGFNTVLFAEFKEHQGKGEFSDPSATFDGIHRCFAFWSNVTHWQPLPEPPQK